MERKSKRDRERGGGCEKPAWLVSIDRKRLVLGYVVLAHFAKQSACLPQPVWLQQWSNPNFTWPAQRIPSTRPLLALHSPSAHPSLAARSPTLTHSPRLFLSPSATLSPHSFPYPFFHLSSTHNALRLLINGARRYLVHTLHYFPLKTSRTQRLWAASTVQDEIWRVRVKCPFIRG